VSETKNLRRGSSIFLSLALIVLVIHAGLLFGARTWTLLPLVSNLIELASALLAAIACTLAARRMENFGRYFWMLVAAGFYTWSFAQVICTYYESILHASLQSPWPSDIIFFLSMTPLLTTVFLDPQKGFDRKQWPRIFDMLQVVILTVAAYLFTFQTPKTWRQGWDELYQFAWTPETARDLILFGTFSLCALWAQHKVARKLYGRLAIFSFVYLCCEVPYLYLQALHNLKTGSFWDLTWSVPFLLATVLAATSDRISEVPSEKAKFKWKRPRGREWGLVHVASLIFPLLILLMAAGIAELQLATAITLVLVSFACSVARILVSEHQQLQAAKALEESNALLKSVFEGTGDALFVKNLEGRYVLVNQTFAEMFHLGVNEVFGVRAADLLEADASKVLAEQDRTVLETGVGRSFEYSAQIDGTKHAFLTNKAPYRDANEKVVGIIGVVRDITEQKQIEEHLRQSQKMEAIGTLAGGVAHDFNNLLMVISGYSSVLSDALANDTKLRGHVDQIQKASERATSLTRQLLAFSRKQTIQPSAMKLNLTIAGMEKLLHRLIGEHILISTQLAQDLGTVLADVGQMEQVILNLAINARDAMPEGGQLTFETRNVEFGDSIASANNMKPGRYVEFVVKDTGAGMDMAVQTRLFEPFFTTKPAGKGTGLGLSTVYGILKQANGNITFTSQPGHGSTFRIYLPRTDSVQIPSRQAAEKYEALDGREKVFLVEDDAAVCDLIRAVLTSHGYTVVCPARPQDAEQVFEKHGEDFDLLLSDVVMPEISGTELAKRLSARNPRMKVLFMSGYIGDAIVRQGIQEKGMGFLQKPFAPMLLAKKVREVLDETRVKES
jgi:two-component system, cell cycle sensor histidine kinase and response regulator CckA